MPGKQGTSLSTRARHIVIELYASAYNAIKTYVRYPMWIVSDLLSTPLWLIMFLLPILLFLPKGEWGDPEVYRHFYWGMIFWQIVSMALWSIGFAIRREQQMGTIEPLFLTNANRIIIFAGRVIVMGIDLIISMTYLTFIMAAFFGVDISIEKPALLALGLALSMLMSLGFGALYGSLVIKLKEAGALSNILQFVIIGLAGVFFPVTKLPENVRTVSYAIPYTYCIDIVRYAAMGTGTLLDPALEFSMVLVMALVFLAVGYLALIKFEEDAKKTGHVGTY